jgi:hypothetical protein
MGTRADFYIGRGESAEWLGSIAWDGYPDGMEPELVSAETEDAFKTALAAFASKRDDWTKPEQGWPWPWETSRTTDYAYAFDEGKVWASCFGRGWQSAAEYDGDLELPKTAVFPDMSERKNVTFGPRSGVIVVTA